MLRILFLGTLIAMSTAYAADPQRSNAWSRIQAPISGATQAIGGYANGCQLGAHVLPERGDGYMSSGYVSIRRHRNRFYSQPVTLNLINTVASAMARYGQSILVGDLSQPAGGKMPYGHSSHQNGLDVDFWFYTVANDTQPAAAIEPPTTVDKVAGTMRLDRWQPIYEEALMSAAAFPETTRIFVNPIIKKYLCGRGYPDHLLQKIRPWWGHDAHFHVRLRCPVNSPDCENQAPVPSGSGCTADLDNWIRDQREAIINPKPPKPSKPKPPKPLHPRCAALLND